LEEKKRRKGAFYIPLAKLETFWKLYSPFQPVILTAHTGLKLDYNVGGSRLQLEPPLQVSLRYPNKLPNWKAYMDGIAELEALREERETLLNPIPISGGVQRYVILGISWTSDELDLPI
jgi:hypothetical protein